MNNNLPKYPTNKPSGVQWLGEIPEHWEAVSLGSIIELKSDKNHPDYEVLSVYREYGVIKKDSRDDNHNATSLDTSNYKGVEPGDLVVNKMKAWQGSMGISAYKGIVSPAYITCKINAVKIHPEYLHQLLRCNLYIGEYNRLSYGVRVGQWDMHYEDFKHITTTIPPIREQVSIANFLSQKTTLIEQAIGIKEKQIELLKERRQILIHKAVTRGLNPDVKLKDSGVEWIGEIPEHWEVKALKYCTKIFRGKFTHRPRNDERLYDGDYPFFQTGDVARAGKYLSEFRQTLNDFGLRVSTLFPKGTIVITIAANIGDISILDVDACFPDSIVGFEPMCFIEKDFLYNSLLVMKEQFMSSTIKNTQMNLNVDRIGINSIAIAPKLEQIEILDYIEISTSKISTALSLKQQEIEMLKEYKAVLINGAVTGKIKVE